MESCIESSILGEGERKARGRKERGFITGWVEKSLRFSPCPVWNAGVEAGGAQIQQL